MFIKFFHKFVNKKIGIHWYPTTIMAKIFLDFLMFDQIFFSPEVKRSVIISMKHGIYELPHELPNDLT